MDDIAKFDLPTEPMSQITIEQLIDTRWTFGPEGGPTYSTFFLGRDGRVEGYEHPNENSWIFEDNSLKIYSIHGTLTWNFTVGDLSSGLILYSHYQPDPDQIPRHILREFVPAAQKIKAASFRKKMVPALQSMRKFVWSSGISMIPSGKERYLREE